MIRDFNSWTEVTRGIYRYVIAANVCYEIHVMYWDEETPIETAKSSLFLVGRWKTNDGKDVFERELLLEEQPLFTCIAAADEDDKENNL